ncbi:hypothetical protein Tco_0542564 [Tanacetum coccineum]
MFGNHLTYTNLYSLTLLLHTSSFLLLLPLTHAITEVVLHLLIMVKQSFDLNVPKDSSNTDEAAQLVVPLINVVDIDEFCLHDLKDMVVKLGYGVAYLIELPAKVNKVTSNKSYMLQHQLVTTLRLHRLQSPERDHHASSPTITRLHTHAQRSTTTRRSHFLRTRKSGEPMFITGHMILTTPEPINPSNTSEDKHEFSAEEQPILPVDSPTVESPGYVTKSDPKEDPEEYEDGETKDGPVDYPMDGGDNGDDDDGDSSRDDTDEDEVDEDEDDEDDEMEEEEHIAPADSTIVAPVDEPVFPPDGTDPIIPPPSTDITIRARITVWPHTSISLPPEAEVERLLTMTTPSPSPPILLSPPSAGERLARCTAPPAHSSPLLPSSGLPQEVVFCPSLVPQVIRSERVLLLDLPEDTGRFPIAVLEIAHMTVGEVNTRVIELAEIYEHDTQDLYALLEDTQDRDSIDGEGGGLCFPRGLGSLDRIESGDSSRATQHQVHETHFQMQQAELATLRETDHRHQDKMVETLRVIRDMRREMRDMQAELLALQEQQRRAGQPGLEAKIPDHQDASGDADSHI